MMNTMKKLIAYYSRAGNNIVGGNIVNLPIGNTEVAAKMIQQLCLDARAKEVGVIKQVDNAYWRRSAIPNRFQDERRSIRFRGNLRCPGQEGWSMERKREPIIKRLSEMISEKPFRNEISSIFPMGVPCRFR